MPVTDITRNLDERKLTLTAEFAAPVERLWQVYADPRQLERVWGPPGYPATFVDHSLTPGGRMNYYMQGPDGERYHGYWDIQEVNDGQSFRFLDGFAKEDFTPDENLPVGENTFRFESIDGGSRLIATTTYASAEDFQTVLDMGMEEGATQAVNQIDGLVAAA
ncbi:SRPBCC domain-containing protein [Tessaracoccus lubricantis]|uniref:SRPBCC domain-containing protein n=1 Tax=Tessaracoccus lubricantis TaxID=545543 RepID=A0ABP9EXV2_9ACTN